MPKGWYCAEQKYRFETKECLRELHPGLIVSDQFISVELGEWQLCRIGVLLGRQQQVQAYDNKSDARTLIQYVLCFILNKTNPVVHFTDWQILVIVRTLLTKERGARCAVDLTRVQLYVPTLAHLIHLLFWYTMANESFISCGIIFLEVITMWPGRR